METVLGMSALSVSSTGVDIMYIVYKTTNKITGDYYIGSHKIGRYDNHHLYLGSGNKLREQILKYGEEFFVRETLASFNDGKEAIDFEHQLIANFRDDVSCLNLSFGGNNFDHINSNGLNNSSNNYIKAHNRWTELMKNEDYRKLHSERIKEGLTDESRKKLSEQSKLKKTFLGKNHTEETKHKLSLMHKGKHCNEKNSQFGTYWITDGNVNKKWKDEKGPIPNNFYKGRVVTND